ncbi:hypothetical protein NDU88_009100 [Pleurodeles waltl]|uniref:Uncharacterized protein n=1 Tax=Pleurodeles waltl TaxID=8319 RepID=A0AAV7QTM2_PLEWA|nr:hypothetical protein NDU88_009100 [Pleurodeles waltl]
MYASPEPGTETLCDVRTSASWDIGGLGWDEEEQLSLDEGVPGESLPDSLEGGLQDVEILQMRKLDNEGKVFLEEEILSGELAQAIAKGSSTAAAPRCSTWAQVSILGPAPVETGPRPLLRFKLIQALAGERSQRDPQCPAGSLGPAVRLPEPAAGATPRGPLFLLQPRPAIPRKAAALRERRGRKPLLGPDGSAWSTARVGSAAGAQPRRPQVSCTALGLRARAARVDAFAWSFEAGPSGAETLGVRHVPDPGHAPCLVSHIGQSPY